MFTVGLTGGIASGKSAASAHFEHLGAPVIDTDLLSRELVEPGQPALDEIVALFGEDVLDDTGRLDRARLRRQVFAEPGLRKQLEAILHPRIRTEMLRRAAAADYDYVVLVIPLLFETGQQTLVDRVLLIDVPAAVQRARAMARDGVDAGQIDAILDAQVDRETRRQLADDIIDNDGQLESLLAEVERLHPLYLELARHSARA
jgi:dephospho-CoA kinase